MRASPESPPMFQSPYLDFFTRTPWWVVPLIWLPVAGACLARGLGAAGLSLGASLGVAALFVLIWTFSEYTLHRWVFHWQPRTRWGPRFHFFLHGVHHDWPNDRYRLVMPPAAAAVLALLFFGLFRALLGPAWVWPAFSGFILGYIVYDCTHYALHHGRLGWPAFKRLKAHHMNHHFNHPDTRFGVSSPLWDHVFRTLEPRRG